MTPCPAGSVIVRSLAQMRKGARLLPPLADACSAGKGTAPPWRAVTTVLLLGQAQRELAVADAASKDLGKTRRGLLAIGRYQLGKCREQAGLCQAIPIDAVDARLDPRFTQIAQRRPLLLMVRRRPRNLGRSYPHRPAFT